MGVRGGNLTAQRAYAGETPVSVYAGESLELAKEGRPHPRMWITPDDYELSTVDLGAGTGATFHWDPDTATSVSVVLPDLDDPITDITRRSHHVTSFQLSDGHYADSVGTIVATNASGTERDQATLTRYWPCSLTVTPRAILPANVGLLVFERYALDITLQARPWPGETDFTITPGREKGSPSNHQLWRFFSTIASDARQTRSLTGAHAPIIQRLRGANETVTYTITVINRRRDGRELSRDTATFSLRWT